MSKKCNNCGHESIEGAAFCVMCGSPLSARENEPATTKDTAAASDSKPANQPVSEHPYDYSKEQAPPKQQYQPQPQQQYQPQPQQQYQPQPQQQYQPQPQQQYQPRPQQQYQPQQQQYQGYPQAKQPYGAYPQQPPYPYQQYQKPKSVFARPFGILAIVFALFSVVTLFLPYADVWFDTISFFKVFTSSFDVIEYMDFGGFIVYPVILFTVITVISSFINSKVLGIIFGSLSIITWVAYILINDVFDFIAIGGFLYVVAMVLFVIFKILDKPKPKHQIMYR